MMLSLGSGSPVAHLLLGGLVLNRPQTLTLGVGNPPSLLLQSTQELERNVEKLRKFHL